MIQWAAQDLIGFLSYIIQSYTWNFIRNHMYMYDSFSLQSRVYLHVQVHLSKSDEHWRSNILKLWKVWLMGMGVVSRLFRPINPPEFLGSWHTWGLMLTFLQFSFSHLTSISRSKWPIFATMASSFICKKCLLIMMSVQPVAVIKMLASWHASSIVVTS